MRIGYVILSIPERHNICVFKSLGAEVAQSLAKEQALACQYKLGLSDDRLISWEEICNRVQFDSAYERVVAQYQNHRSFKAHCLSQTYSNLQPRFREIGVRKKTDERVRQSVFYLLEELAIKVGAFESGEFHGEILPREEMNIVQKIYEGTYFPCRASNRGFRVISMLKSGFSQIYYEVQ